MDRCPCCGAGLPRQAPPHATRFALLDELPELTGFPASAVEQAAERIRNLCAVHLTHVTVYDVAAAERILDELNGG